MLRIKTLTQGWWCNFLKTFFKIFILFIWKRVSSIIIASKKFKMLRHYKNIAGWTLTSMSVCDAPYFHPLNNNGLFRKKMALLILFKCSFFNSVRYISISILEIIFCSPMLTLNWSPSSLLYFSTVISKIFYSKIHISKVKKIFKCYF